MQLTTTFLLLAFAAYVRADLCTPCPEMIDGESIASACAWNGRTVCEYPGKNLWGTGPYCSYFNEGINAGECDYTYSFKDCPSSMSTGLSNCNTCKTG
ncbi:hypothetical protein EDC04DRAFT_2629419 [Pisolithus marmoratus]|nr:hypothetical protein EDC04DRAFT_2629419 [Pisolithus marmoratus]